ncbi:hypothetical protein [Comamonas sp.]|uniref:hypothetical protein n=1 Tax=Comamonas sp. TaxID=34028 RepID=UPI0012C2D59F|nr:hypothetical protein [Comamonas sp.]MPT13163.1 hypothetical protein [Comamonas sp.]
MFKVKFVRTIFGTSSPFSAARFAPMHREAFIPFAPTVGQEFFWGLERPQKAASVTWSFTESSFTCKLEDVFADESGIDGFDFQESLEDSTINGWTLAGVFESP